MRSALLYLAVATAAAAPRLLAAQVPVVTLARPIAELAEPLDRAYSAAELRDGRVVVTDMMGASVQVVDFAKGTVAPVGRSGAGPNEYRMPERVIPGAGDSLLVIDVGQRRFLRIAPDGTPAGTIPFPEAAGFGRFRGADRQGRFYYQGSRMGGTPGNRTRVVHEGPEAKPADSVPVIRWDPKSGRLDTMGLVLEPALAKPAQSTSGGRTVIMSRPEPFTPQDEWTVTPDGRVVMLRSGTYRADWRTADGRRGSGPPVAYEKVRVTQADKDRLTKGSRQAVIAGGAKIDMAPESAGDFNWPTHKPPFQPSSAQATPDGRVWVQRSAAEGAAPVYDEFDETGRLVRQIAVAKGSRVVGFGKGVVYVARTDEDDLVYLQKFAR